jgi:single-strand selective monofunctional uracil DNA glycosylase
MARLSAGMSSSALHEATERLIGDLSRLRFAPPVAVVYNPLIYAAAPHRLYVERFGEGAKRVLFLGMNPGPWGMAQTGVPFGEIAAVRDWMKISAPVSKPVPEHPKRPVVGFACEKSEVSGRRLWGLFQEKFSEAENFFSDHYVVNYCPLVWMEDSGRNRTPDKLPSAEQESIRMACDAYVAAHLEQMTPDFVVGVGAYAEAALQRAVAIAGSAARVSRILHPSPASPAANRDWSGTAMKQLIAEGVWSR